MNLTEWDKIYDYETDKLLRDSTYPLSGWKLYISGESQEDSEILNQFLSPLIKKYNLAWKSSKKRFFELSKGSRKEKVSLFIYFPVSIVNESKHNLVIRDISDILFSNKYLKDFPLYYAQKLCSSIYSRYEMDIPFRKEGFDRESYFKHRKKGGDSFNLKDNFNIFKNL